MKPVLIFLILSSIVLAQPIDWFAAQRVHTSLDVSSSIDFQPVGLLPHVEKLTVDVTFIPRPSDTVKIEQFEIYPDALATSERIRYTWTKPTNNVSFGYRAFLSSTPNTPLVRAKIPFPLQSAEFREYTKPTLNIDSDNSAIHNQALLIAKNKDDLFTVASTIGIWVKNNVAYNLTTLTADVSQPASWVLANRTGVCDELTGLFIAMLRSLGIPARFVSGVAFTNSAQFPAGWGAHGWAEVYFPGVGWVPYDPTFGEFGWVDPGHIPLKISDDPQDPAIVYEWKARDTNVEVHDLTIQASHVDAVGFIELPLQLSLEPVRQRVGFGSANGLVLTVDNQGDSYAAWEFTLSRVKDMTVLGSESQQIVLAPHSSGKLFWTVKVAENLDTQYQYELPLVISTIRNDTVKSAFYVGQWDPVIPLAEINAAQARYNTSASDPFDLSCALASDRITIAVGSVNCTLENHKSTPLTLNVCYTTCKPITLAANGRISMTFDVLAETPGTTEVAIVASTGTINKSAVLTLQRLDKPHVELTSITAPQTISYDAPLEVTFTVARKSFSTPLNVTVTARDQTQVDLGTLATDQQVTIRATGDQIVSNHLPIRVTYFDEQGTMYTVDSDVSIIVTNAPWYKPLLDWLRELF